MMKRDCWRSERKGLRALGLFFDPLRVLVVAQSNKLGMPQVFAFRPFHELKLSDNFRTNPATLAHLLCGQSGSPPACICFGQIDERALVLL